MNVLSLLPIPRTLSFFSSAVIGGIFMWSTLLLIAISTGNNVLLGVLINPFISKQVGKDFNWLFMFFILIVSYIIGELFLAVGDIFLNTMFRESLLDIKDIVYATWNQEKDSFLIENLSLEVEYPAITLDIYQNVDENLYLEKSEYYYSLSNLFAGLLLALISSIALVLSIKRNPTGTLVVDIIPLIWGCASVFLMLKSRIFLKFLKLKGCNHERVIRFIIFGVIPCFSLCFVFSSILENTQKLHPIIGLNGLESLTILNFAFLLLVSIFLAIRYRELANLFLYMAYLEARRDKD